MKNTIETKTHIISIKVTETQYKTIKQYAEEDGLSVSSYLTSKGMQKKNISPSLLVKMQNIVNIAVRIIQEHEPDTMRFLRKEMNEIWEYLS